MKDRLPSFLPSFLESSSRRQFYIWKIFMPFYIGVILTIVGVTVGLYINEQQQEQQQQSPARVESKS